LISIGFALLRNGGLYQMPDSEQYLRRKLKTYNIEGLIEYSSAKIDSDKSSTVC
jgi:hypothetical protein